MLGVSVRGAACQLSRLPQPQLVDQQLHCRVKQDLVRLWSLCWAGWILELYVSNILMIVIILSDKSSLSAKIILPSAPCFGLPGFHYHVSCLSFLRLIAIGISLITSIIFGDSCKLWNFSLCIFFLPLFRSYFLRVRLHICGDSLHKFTHTRFIKVSLVGIIQYSTWLKESLSPWQTQSIALDEGQSLVGLWVSCAIGWEWGKPTCQSRGFNLIRRNQSRKVERTALKLEM